MQLHEIVVWGYHSHSTKRLGTCHSGFHCSTFTAQNVFI